MMREAVHRPLGDDILSVHLLSFWPHFSVVFIFYLYVLDHLQDHNYPILLNFSVCDTFIAMLLYYSLLLEHIMLLS